MALNQDSNGGLWGQQDKDSFLDYSFDWSDWLSAGDSIASSTWATDAALTLNSGSVSGSITTIWVQGGLQNKWYAVTNTVTTASGRRDQRTFRLFITDDTATSTVNDGSLLFKNRFNAIEEMRRDRLMMAAQGAMPAAEVSDDYIWSKLKTAEAEVARMLRVPLVPTQFFPAEPTQDEIAALNGMPWAIDPGYDYAPTAFGYNDTWGMIKTRNKPLKSVSRVRFAYPGGELSHYDLPLDWLRMDKKYGTIQFVPSSTAFIAPLNAFVMQAIGNGRTIPLAIQLTYVAGLDDVENNWPDILDLVKKKAVLSIVEDSFAPSSGSISADGLSQSMSIQMDAYHDMIDRKVNGGKGSNGGLMTAIHGVRLSVMGG